MTRYGPMFGPDITFLGVPACDWRQPETYADADVVIIGAPFDGGTSHRPGARFGPQVIRGTDYLPHDGSRPHMAMRVDALTGDLTVKDVTRPVVLDVEFDGAQVDPWGGQRLGFSAHTEIDREDWGLTWNVALETGGVLVGKKIRLEFNVEAVKQ